MNEESTSLFRVFRVLWFPMSINAMVLGAGATLLFHVVTWIACLFAGDGGLANAASPGFLCASVTMVRTSTWPGYATSEGKDGSVVHHELASEKPDPAQAKDDLALVGSAIGGFLAERRAAIAADAGLDPKKKTAKLGELETLAGRYRWIFGAQVAAFFLLLATFGVAICRIIALRIARDEYCPLGSAFAYAWRVKITGILFPVAVLLPMAFLAGCNLLVGTLAQIPYLGWLLGIIPLPLVILSSLLIVLISLGGFLSIPLIPAAIAIERKGTYDSLGKTFNYVFARPLPLILYLQILAVFLWVLWALFVDSQLVERVMTSTLVPFWDNPAFERIVTGESGAKELGPMQSFCAAVYGFVLKAFHLLVIGGLVSYALGAGTSMFLVLRKDVDGLDYADVARDPIEAARTAAQAVPAPATPPPAA